MYTQPTVLGTKFAAVGATTGGAALAYTGLNVAHYVVAAVTLVFLGVALLRLVPRRES